jgi:hypothetical protein
MSEGLLYPRLPPAVAQKRLDELRALPPSLLAREARVHDRDAVFAALGGAQAGEQHLQELRAALVEVAARAGYPAERGTRASRERFDLEAAQVLRDRMQIVAAEAAAIDVWGFLGVLVVPDLCFWRFPSPPNDRVIGPDLTRHTFSRLWWRAYQLADLEPSGGLSALEAIPESVMNQLFERRSIGGNRLLVRGIARALLASPDRWPEIPRRRLVRDGIRRLRRLLAFTAPEALDEQTLADLIEQVFEETASALLAAPYDADARDDELEDESDEQDEPTQPEGDDPSLPSSNGHVPAAAGFDHLALGEIPAKIAMLVGELGGVTDHDLSAAFQRRYGIDVPEEEAQLLRRFAWSAKGRRFVELDKENQLWLPGSHPPQRIEQLGAWTIATIYDRALVLLHDHPQDDPFPVLVEEVYRADGRRVPRLVMSLVGKLINKARRDLGMPRRR